MIDAHRVYLLDARPLLSGSLSLTDPSPSSASKGRHHHFPKAATSSFGGMINHCANHCYKSKELHIFEKTVLRDSISSEYLCREYKNRWVDGKSSQEGDPNRCLSIEITPDLIVYRSAAESILQSNSSAFLVLVFL